MGVHGEMSVRATLRRATPRDAPRLRAMHRASLMTLGADAYSARQIETFLDEVGTVDEALLGDGTYMIAELGDAIAASGGWTLRRPSYDAHLPEEARKAPRKGRATIRSVFTDPRFARKGLASSIIEICEGEAAARGNATRLDLCATLSGLPLYRKLDYRSDASVSVPLSNGERFEAIYMTKSIAGRRRAVA
jgi:GNAT superfamily N-acetyltransferase